MLGLTISSVFVVYFLWRVHKRLKWGDVLPDGYLREVVVVDDQLLSERIKIERKQFFFDLKENPRGRFLRITEDVGGRRDTIIVPCTGLDLFREALNTAIAANSEFSVSQSEAV